MKTIGMLTWTSHTAAETEWNRLLCESRHRFMRPSFVAGSVFAWEERLFP
jgi:hypothetical protein